MLKRPAYEASIGFGWNRTAPSYELHVVQTMDGEPIVFEAKSRTNPLADTTSEIKLAGDGALVALSGGETDRSVEILTTALDLAKAAAIPADANRPGPPPPNPCTELHRRIREHKKQIAPVAATARLRAARIEAEERDLQAALEKGDATVPARLTRLRSLRAESERVVATLDADRLPLSSSDFSVTVSDGARCDGQPCPAVRVQGDATACIQVALQLERTL